MYTHRKRPAKIGDLETEIEKSGVIMAWRNWCCSRQTSGWLASRLCEQVRVRRAWFGGAYCMFKINLAGVKFRGRWPSAKSRSICHAKELLLWRAVIMCNWFSQWPLSVPNTSSVKDEASSSKGIVNVQELATCKWYQQVSLHSRRTLALVKSGQSLVLHRILLEVKKVCKSSCAACELSQSSHSRSICRW